MELHECQYISRHIQSAVHAYVHSCSVLTGHGRHWVWVGNMTCFILTLLLDYSTGWIIKTEGTYNTIQRGVSVSDLGRLFHVAITAWFMHKVRWFIHPTVHEHCTVISCRIRHHILLVGACRQRHNISYIQRCWWLNVCVQYTADTTQIGTVYKCWTDKMMSRPAGQVTNTNVHSYWHTCNISSHFNFYLVYTSNRRQQDCIKYKFT